MTATTITLASASPRRKDILTSLELDFRVRAVDIDEKFSDVPSEVQPVILAEEKMREFLKWNSRKEHPWILTADTIVEYEGRKIGKPETPEEAEEYLRLFSGAVHRVITGLTFFSRARGSTSDSSVTEVEFAPLQNDEIAGYIATGEWKGVAAGYRIQQKGGCLISSIRGSYSNVTGLPIHTFYGMLKHHNYPFPW